MTQDQLKADGLTHIRNCRCGAKLTARNRIGKCRKCARAGMSPNRRTNPDQFNSLVAEVKQRMADGASQAQVARDMGYSRAYISKLLKPE